MKINSNYEFFGKVYIIFFIKSTFLSAFILFNQSLAAEIKFFCTAALINNQYEIRKQEYIACLKRISELGYQPFVVESCVQGPTFLDDYATDVFYSQTNNPRLRNKGVNEAVSMLASFSHFNFQDDDMIIKFTGRYHMTSDRLIQLIKTNPEFDIFVIALNQYNQTFTACFAMRYRLLKEMLQNIDYTHMENHMVNFERILGDYAQKSSLNGIKVLFIHEPLGVVCRVGESNQILSF